MAALTSGRFAQLRKTERPVIGALEDGLMTTFEPSLVLPFRNSWYRGHARLTGRNVLINDVRSRAAQAVAVAFSREGAMVFIAVGVQAIAATGLCDLIVKEGGRASLLQGGTEQERSTRFRCMLPYGCLDVLLNIAPPLGIAFGDANDSERQGTTAAGMIAPTIAALAAHRCAPRLVISAIFDLNDDCGNRGEDFATEEAAHLELSQALQDRNIRVNAVRISSAQLKSGGALEAYLEEVAMAFVYLATDEAANMNGLVLAKEIEVSARH
jgi:hypothetical protein